MKKTLVIITIILISYTLKINFTRDVEFEDLILDQLPKQVQSELLRNSESSGFSIYSDDKYTYVVYRADHQENEYISTDLLARKKKDKYIITSVVDRALKDNHVSYEKVIRLENVPEKNIVLNEKDKR